MRPPIVIALVSAETVRPLRWRVLRPGRPAESAHFPEDEALTTWHFAALLYGNDVVGVASYFLEGYPDLPAICAYRLRGMATHPDYQRSMGIGRELLLKSLSFLYRRGVDLVWCYARLSAVPFYEKMHFSRWEAAGTIDIPDVGPHEVWYKYLLEHKERKT
ncbi:MAG: GNAT family N-acetyltransferase [Bacteroidia bacterium]|nr:GNAT family N-acetyltransferase [Bacteroidia bacterium]